MGETSDADVDFLVGDTNPSAGVKEVAEDLLGASILVAHESASQVSIKSVGDEGQHDVQIDLNGNG